MKRLARTAIPIITLLIAPLAAYAQEGPSDPFVGASPAFDTSPPEPAKYNVGDWGVAEQRGSATYTYPITVPPGRNEMAPSLVLRYSSQSPLRGGVAVGWTSDGLPSIRIDSSLGLEGEPVYKASLGGISGRLIKVPDRSIYGGETYRAEFDGTFTRFERVPLGSGAPEFEHNAGWLALTTDGVRHYFEESFSTSDFVRRWQITKQVDPFGNSIHYTWERVSLPGTFIDFAIRRIEYGANATAGLNAHAKVDFEYAPLEFCEGSSVPIGARFALDNVIEGARRLTAVTTSVKDTPDSAWRVVRRVALGYDMKALGYTQDGPRGFVADPTSTRVLGCGQYGAPLRYLTRFNVTAFDREEGETRLPPVTFEYGRKQRLLRSTHFASSPGYGHYGSISGAFGTLLDVDGDGIRDRVSVVKKNGICTLVRQKGLFGGTFEAVKREQPFPTTGEIGRCNLNGVFTVRSETFPNFAKITESLISYHFMDVTGDGRVDLLTNTWSSHYVVSGPSDPPAPPLRPERKGAGYLWRVHLNQGTQFSPFKTEVVSPPVRRDPRRFPPSLPPSASDERIDVSAVADATIPSLADLDGDGFLDFIDIGEAATLLSSPNGNWSVNFGKKGGKFGDKYEWPVPRISLARGARGYFVDDSDEKHLRRTVLAALHDINGDSLPDLVVQASGGHLMVAWNYGSGFQSPIHLGLKVPLQETQTDYTKTGISGGKTVVLEGNRGYRRRMVDVDGDGLLDMLVFLGDRNDITRKGRVQVHFNVGDRFLPARSLPAGSDDNPNQSQGWANAKRLVRFKNGKWSVTTDFVDGDGDGLPDLVEWFDAFGIVAITGDMGPRTSPRALTNVDNGRGLRIEFKYASTTDPRVASWDNPSTYLPNPLWVVSSVDVSGGHGTPTMTTRYHYEDPAFQPPSGHTDDPQPNRFLGFRKVTTTTEAPEDGTLGRRIRRAFAYDEKGDPSGRVVKEWTYRAEGGDFRIHEYKEITWEQEPLFSGEVLFTHRDLTLTRTCTPEATESQCMTQDVNVHRIKEVWKPRFPTTDPTLPVEDPLDLRPYLYVQEVTHKGMRLAEGEQDRRTTSQFQVRYGQSAFRPDDYRILPTWTVIETTWMSDVGLRFQKIGQTRTRYDRGTGLPVQTDRWINQATVASTKRTFNPRTGNLLTETKPEQAAPEGSGRSTTYVYGPHKLFVEITTNELEQSVMTTYDVATGAMLERRGPNRVLKDDGFHWERETWKVDGFGRVLEHAVSTDDEVKGYALHTVDKTMYFGFESPNRVSEQHLRDFDGDVWVTSDRTFDGLGRLLTETQHLDGDINAVTIYGYDKAGNLAAIDVPDPTDDGKHVRYTYTYDGLNRVTRFTRPNDTAMSIAYAGLEKTLTEITTDGSGSTTKLVYDVFGRLVEVHEFDPESRTAITKYTYDANDNLIRVTDADGNVTTLSHDWVGNRIQIQRGPRRIWRYLYDRNGNLTAEIAPVPIGADAADYTTSYGYDDLDRVAIRTPASRGMADVRVAQLGIGPIHFVYDDERNGIGRLTGVRLPFGKVTYTYNAQGLVSFEQRSFEVNHLVTASGTQSVRRQYNALGNPTLSEWDDEQKWLTTYDERGLVATVEWFDPRPGVSGWKKVAEYERSIAGQPRKRETSFGQVREYGYDVLGRPVHDVILKLGGPGVGVISKRAYAFADSGDLKSVTGTTAGVSPSASYTYDARHRLKTASGPSEYSGSFTYSPAGNIETADVRWNASPSTRNIRYEYGARDPQAVDRLVNIAGGQPFAEFTYDMSGNMTERVTPDGIWTFEWDGENQLREAEGASGAEVYYYDHKGQRILAVNETGGVRFWFAESETHYDVSGTRTRRYLHLSNNGVTLARVEDDTDIELQYADALRNLMLSLDEEGNVVASFLYGAYGEVVHSTGEDDHRRQFNGKENDVKTGLRYYGFRYYDPLILRWNSADPLYRFLPDLGLMNPQRMNLYAFSLNNPVRYFDPDGRDVNEDELICEPAEPGICEAEPSVTGSSDEKGTPGSEAHSGEGHSGLAAAMHVGEKALELTIELLTEALDKEIHGRGRRIVETIVRTYGHGKAAGAMKGLSRASLSNTGLKLAGKSLSALSVGTGVHKALTSQDPVEQSKGGLDAGWGVAALLGGPVLAAGALGNAIGQGLDDVTGGAISDAIADKLLQADQRLDALAGPRPQPHLPTPMGVGCCTRYH